MNKWRVIIKTVLVDEYEVEADAAFIASMQAQAEHEESYAHAAYLEHYDANERDLEIVEEISEIKQVTP